MVKESTDLDKWAGETEERRERGERARGKETWRNEWWGKADYEDSAERKEGIDERGRQWRWKRERGDGGMSEQRRGERRGKEKR